MSPLYDSFNRKIDYMRISITDRCNLRCTYCMPAEGIQIRSHEEILQYEEIKRFAQAAVKAGITKIRLTGGEPLVRRDIVALIEMLANIEGLEDLALTTNGLLLPKYGKELKNAGLKRVNISLDSFNPDAYKKLTRSGSFDDAIAGIETALFLGFEPVKINAVLIRGVNDDPTDFIDFIYKYPVHVRFIEFMPISKTDEDAFISAEEIQQKIEAIHMPLSTGGPFGAGPARYMTFTGAQGTLGFINAISSHFCSKCNRIRLTPDGKLRPCLFSDSEFDIRALLRDNVSDEEIIQFIKDVINQKPERHNAGDKERMERLMCQIGG